MIQYLLHTFFINHLFRRRIKGLQVREHERYYLFIIYEDKQVNLHRKDTFSKTHFAKPLSCLT